MTSRRRPSTQVTPIWIGTYVVISRCRLKNEEIDRLHDAAAGGATLLFVHPSWNTAHRFGWDLQPNLTHPGWIVTPDGRPGAGTPIQTHVPIIHAAPGDVDAAQTVATTLDLAWEPAGGPSVTTQKCGRGAVAIWWFDVGKAIARIRFGNPDLADTIGNGHWGWPHALDLFVGHVDDRVAHLPQADFHGQLLAQVITQLAPLPIARLWYYPEASQRSALIFQSDDDWSTTEQFEALVGALEKNFMCGSGRPIRFCDLDGTVYDCWQQPVPTYDDASLQERIGREPDAVFAEFDERFVEAIGKTHTAFGVLSHPVSFATYSRPFIERCFERAADADVRIWNPDAWLQFQDRRRRAAVVQRREGEVQVVTVSGLAGEMTMMLPAAGQPEVTVNGAAATVHLEERLGCRYAFVRICGEGSVQVRIR